MVNLSVLSPGKWMLDISGDKNIVRPFFGPDDDATRRDATTTQHIWDYLAPLPSHPGTEYLVRDPLT